MRASVKLHFQSAGVFLCGLWVYAVMLGLVTADIKEQARFDVNSALKTCY